MDKEIVIGGRKISYQVEGNGNPVILVHGFGEDRNVWKHQVEFLEKYYTVIVPDLPGSGKSESIPDMSMDGLAMVLKEIITKELQGPENKICMIGHSMGGYVTLAYAEKEMDALNGFGLFHSTAYADSEEKKATRRKGIEFTRQHGAFAFFQASTPNLYSEKTKKERPALIDDQVAALRNFSDEAMVRYYEGMMQRPDRTIVLQKATVPVLFIIGEDDNAIPAKDMLKQSHLPGKAHIHVLRESGHMGMVEEKDKSNHILRSFLQEIYTETLK